ncbi:geranylgeranyl transferase type-2 subunit beta-like isoform X2 [Paramacrobiotus metropolitanus]|uniref:geranylgeranyl transferase type-2 subunit beta-like isoform X2 n=1 Tax=Paramacrobiotus metropolitanus TaxID=2943436 RepID=UPI002446149D|nr:geranylgeranyl transferase type-2 subunit beta-like isoform X2 [Paramacrobiotus metropolitanus]
MAHPQRDATIPADAPTTFAMDKHTNYLERYGEDVDAYEFSMAEYLRISGMYWTVTCLDLLHALHASSRFTRDAVIRYVKSCQTPSGGFAPHPDHDEHLLHTLCAVQILVTFDALAEIDVDGVSRFVVGLQQENGSFAGDRWGEVDTRFSMCGLACLALLGRLEQCQREKAVEYIRQCQNFDGGFGTSPGAESHAGMIYCSVGSLAILGRLDIVDADKLGLWLAKRQLPSGGLNGRPEKLPDVCYSWWVLASLAIIGRLHWIDEKKLISFILASQDVELGGVADRPGNLADPFHTLFGVAGLSLLSSSLLSAGDSSQTHTFLGNIKTVNPVFCMPEDVLAKHKLSVQILPAKNPR